VRRRPPRPLPVVSGVRARRTPAGIVVTWRAAAPVRHANFLVLASRTRGEAGLIAGRSVAGSARTRFRTVIRRGDRFPFEGRPGPARFVRLIIDTDDRLGSGPEVLTRIG
jgi:hypothetical protein